MRYVDITTNRWPIIQENVTFYFSRFFDIDSIRITPSRQC